MKKMKFLLFVIIGLSFIACKPTEQELIIGKWKYSRLEKGGKPFLSADRAEAKQIIDKLVLENIEYTKNVAKFRENALNEMEQRLNVYLEFKSDSTVAIIDQSSGEAITEMWKYSINEDAHNILLQSGERKIQYVYTLKNNTLKLVEGTLKIELEKVE